MKKHILGNMEIFKDIPGYEGLYQVSNLGNVKSLPRVKELYGGRKQHTKEFVMKQEKRNNGYRMVNLYGSITKRFYIHRLVAMAFIENPEDKQEVNHKNADRADNRVENLEWATRGENQHHKHVLGYKNHFQKNPPNLGKFGKDNKDSKVVLQYKDGKLIKKWYSLMDIKRELGYSIGNISMVCNGARPKANGFTWKYE